MNEPIQCIQCGASITSKPKVRLSGFRIVTCEVCKYEQMIPFSRGIKSAYYILIIIFVVLFLRGIFFDHISFALVPYSLLFLISAYFLFKNKYLTYQLKNRHLNHIVQNKKK
ncbi:MAG: hypothetical protein QM526_01020 [Alphaproteobacteria bacterium]|nr:hypothetical protein [Alphaproteobacteria bacterium]